MPPSPAPRLLLLLLALPRLAQAQPAPTTPTTAGSPPAALPALPASPASPTELPAAASAPRAAAPAATAQRDLFGLARKPAELTGCAAPDHPPDECALEPDDLAARSPLTTTTWLSAEALDRLPVADGLHDSQAAFALGVGRDDGGVFIGGASSLENRWTLEGAPIDSPRTGGLDTRVPLAFLAGLRITTGGFSARDRASSGGVIDAELVRGGAEHRARAQAFVGAQGQRLDRPVLPGSFSVMRGRISEPRTATVSAVASGPLARALGGRLWYAVGVAPSVSLSDFEQTGARLIDRDNDGDPDLRADGGFATEIISRSSRDATSTSVPMMARAGVVRGAHQLDLTVLGVWSQTPRFTAVATPEAAEVERRGLLLDGIASWRGRWAHTAVRAQLAWHRSSRLEAAADAQAGALPQLQTAYVPPEDTLAGVDPRFAAACRDNTSDDRYPGINNCPVLTGWFARQGVGQLTDVTTDRPSLQVDAARQLGAHAVRVGAATEDARLVVRSRFSGGEIIRSLFDGHTDTTRYVDPTDPELEVCKLNIDVPCPVQRQSELTFRTRHVALYLEDTWRPRADVLVDAGVRWEYQQLGSRLRFGSNLAPRAAVAWDPLGHGRSRLAATVGRLFTYLPAGMGERLDQTSATVSDISSPFGRLRVLEPGELVDVLQDVEPMITDELTFAAEVTWPGLGALRARTQHRWLRSGFEDTAEGFGNPATATRRVDVLGVELATDPRAGLAVRAGYAWGQAVGSLVGAYDPRRGSILYTSRDFDFVSTNTAGLLPSSLGHRVYTELAARRRLGSVSLEGGARMALASGHPRSVVLESEVIGPTYLLPRGSAGTMPAILTTDVRLAGRWSRFAVTVQVLNLFSRQVVTNEDELFSRDIVLPIDGGDASDLPFFKNSIGRTAARSLGYRTPTSFQLPISGFVGLEATL